MRRIRQFHFFPGSPWSPKSRPFRGNIGINSGGHDTVMLPYPPMKLPKAHVTRYWSPWNQYSTTKGALPRKHFPPSELALVRVHVHIHDAWTVLVAHLGQGNAVTVVAAKEECQLNRTGQISSGCRGWKKLYSTTISFVHMRLWQVSWLRVLLVELEQKFSGTGSSG